MDKKLTIEEQLNIIYNIFGQSTDGLTIEYIESKTALNLPRRTLQRRLQALQKKGMLCIEGKTHGALYFLIKPQELVKGQSLVQKQVLPQEPILIKDQLLPSTIEQNKNSIFFTEKALDILNLVNKPLFERKPVGYNQDFLLKYQPNITYYLTLEERLKLAELGQTHQQNKEAGTYAKEILSRLLIDLSWNSSRLEGNTYSLLETRNLIEFGQEAFDHNPLEKQMILNHKNAIELLVQSPKEIAFDNYTICNLHALLSENLLPDSISGGRLRKFAVGIGKSAYTPLAVPQLIEDNFALILDKASKIMDPFEQSFFIMVQLPYLQPFEDVNKRLSRLAANIPFIRDNYVPLSFVDVPKDVYLKAVLSVYELCTVDLLKEVFIWAYQRSAPKYKLVQQVIGEPDLFRLKYRDQIKYIINKIIATPINNQEATKEIRNASVTLPMEDRDKFIKMVEEEILSLHEGNFARYRAAPSQFTAWRKLWYKI